MYVAARTPFSAPSFAVNVCPLYVGAFVGAPLPLPLELQLDELELEPLMLLLGAAVVGAFVVALVGAFVLLLAAGLAVGLAVALEPEKLLVSR